MNAKKKKREKGKRKSKKEPQYKDTLVIERAQQHKNAVKARTYKQKRKKKINIKKSQLNLVLYPLGLRTMVLHFPSPNAHLLDETDITGPRSINQQHYNPY